MHKRYCFICVRLNFTAVIIDSNGKSLDTTETSADLQIIANQTTEPLHRVSACLLKIAIVGSECSLLSVTCC